VSFDSSHFTFDPWNDFLGVVMQQGRPQLDSDWNEWLAELARRIQAGTLDTIGRAGYPAITPHAFEIKISQDQSGTNHLTIGAGRMYVDGLLAENHGPSSSAQWDPSLAEMSGAPQIQPPVEVDVDYTKQRYLPGAALPAGTGPFLAYLDVWRRAVTYLECPDMVEKALGVDTTGRLQTVWQVKLLDVSAVAGVTCSTPDSGIAPWQKLTLPRGGQLSTNVVQTSSSGPCCLTPNTGYTGRENQLYRVEIHQPGTPISNLTGPVPLPLKQGTMTFKWSRDNASVATAVTAITAVTVGTTASSRISVQSTGKDNVLRFSANDWVEITDDWLELSGQPGALCKVSSVDDASKTITVSPPLSAASFPLDANGRTDPARHTRLTQWDHKGAVLQSDGKTVWVNLDAQGSTGEIPVPPAGTTLILEDGITVSFGLNAAGGPFNSGDFWCFAARATDGTIETLNQASPLGIHHHYARLAIVKFGSGATDCRQMFPPLTKLTQLHYVSGDGQEAPPGGLLPQPLQAGVANGSFPVVGAAVMFRVVTGTGSLQSAAASGTTVIVPTGPDGVASCTWQLDKLTSSQRVEATLVAGEALPVRFNASFSGLQPVAGIHITGVFGVGADGKRTPLLNDSSVLLDSLIGGIDIVCDQVIDPATVSRPTCFVSIEVPLQMIANPIPKFPAFTLIAFSFGYQTLILEADVSVDSTGRTITWRPSLFTQNLLKVIGPKELPAVRGVLAHLTVEGNFIWSTDKSLYLDGDAFGMAATTASSGHTDLSLPTGDQRRGGTFAMWFWLALIKSVQITTVPTKGAFAPGTVLSGTVEVTSPPATGTSYTVTLAVTSDSPPAPTITSPVTVAAGASTASFTLTTSNQKAAAITITATLGSADSQQCTVATAIQTSG
jgi:hypothetical protein